MQKPVRLKYQTIYADPPWETKAGRPLSGGYLLSGGKQVFNPTGNETRSLPYQSMNINEIASLPIANLSDTNCHLYMWVTNQYLLKALQVIEAWGFKYSTTLVWAKNAMGGGLGGTFKITTEFLVFATKGSLKSKKMVVGTWFNEKRAYKNGAPCHSKKPEFFRSMIESVSPGPYLELFAREEVNGWDCFGNEVPNSIKINE